jgi:hypothetical protein
MQKLRRFAYSASKHNYGMIIGNISANFQATGCMSTGEQVLVPKLVLRKDT